MAHSTRSTFKHVVVLPDSVGAMITVGIGSIYMWGWGLPNPSPCVVYGAGTPHTIRESWAMPPTLRELLTDPIYRLYFTRRLTLPETLTHGQPWQVWAVTHEGKWGSRLFEEYGEAWVKATALYKQEDKFRDVAIVSRRMMFGPPARFVWNGSKYSWCARCRRPSEFRLRSPQHHALRSQPVLTDDAPRRCYYCGIRRAGMRNYQPWV
jgi:hypothetical protein